VPHDPKVVAALVRSAQRGDRLAVSELLDLLTPYIRKLCGPIALDDGADATQESLIVIFRSINQLRDPATLFGWARTIAVREAIRIAKRNARFVPTNLEHVDISSTGDPQLAADIRDTLDRLSPAHRAVLVLRDIEGLDEQHAAELLNIPQGTVKSRLSRARLRFRKAWGK
jgi:RNA polymerase sigma-70 factor (ECF subfamily)